MAAKALPWIVALTASLAQAVSPPAVRARHGMVSAASGIATDAGVEILRRGGNAVDAAVAVGLVEAVTWPSAGNIGGGGFLLIRLASGKSAGIDYREMAPRRATRDMFVGGDGKLNTKLSTAGHLASGVPGTVAGFALALEKYGTLSWSEVVEPARRIAEKGFPVSEWMARSLRQSSRLLEQFPESRRIFLNGGKFYQEGDLLRQPELAATLARLQRHGPREFYEGRTAQMLAAEMREHGGLIDLEDLKAYRAVERTLLRGSYRGYEILGMPPASSGGAVLLEMLNILERYDLRALGHNSSAKYHVLVEAMRRAFADRAHWIGDPAFVKAPISGMISKEYAAERARSIDLARATPSAQVGHGEPAPYESDETTHFSVVDAAGNAVSNTYTIRNGFGNGVTVKGAGFLLNNVMDDFATQPGQPNTFGFRAGEANAIAGGRRPVSSQTPTIVTRDGKLWLVLGSPGGPTISNTVAQVILNLVDHEMELQEAVDAPRIHHQWLPDLISYEPRGLAQDVIDALAARGHAVEASNRGGYNRRGWMGNVNAVMIDPQTGMRLGANDSRNPDGKAAGY